MNSRVLAGFLPLAAWASTLPAQTVTTPPRVTTKAALYSRAAWDSNIYGQMEDAPLQAGFTAGTPEAELGSFVATLGAQVDLGWRAAPWLTVQATYNPEYTWYEAADEESNLAHRLGLAFTGRDGDTDWEWRNAALFVEGADEGLIWARSGGFHATAATLPRDRREMAVYRSTLRVTHRAGAWFFRPVASAWMQDFQTRVSNAAGYGNYIDRSDRSIGIDLGRSAGEGLNAFVGYRLGRMIQKRVLGSGYAFSNSYHRVVAGLEGNIGSAWKVTLLAGPDFRRFDETIPSRLEREDTLLFADAAVTWTPTSDDTLRLAFGRALATASGGAAVYEEAKLEVSWKRKLGPDWLLDVSGVVSEADYEPWASAPRDDWTYRALAGVAWTIRAGLRAEASVLVDFGRTDIPARPARDYDRFVLTAGIRRDW